MNSLDTLLWIINIGLSAATLVILISGFRLAKRALTQNATLYGEKAISQYALLKSRHLKGRECETYIHGGGRLTIPQLRIDKLAYDPDTMPLEWKPYTKRFRFFDQDKDNPQDIRVEEWQPVLAPEWAFSPLT